LPALSCWATRFIPKIELNNNHTNNHNHNQTQAMNHTSPSYFNNHVKFTGSAFESPGDASTVLFQVVLLLMLIFGIGERRN
jgi:hypothetical protein